jgi:RNA polymerase sigma-70 factor (ECF subfamily)
MEQKKSEYTDSELIGFFHEPEKSDYAFNLIVLRYQERLYWHIRKLLIDHEDTDDVLQETFVKAWKGLKGFREDSSLFTWLYRIATNEALSFLRRKKRKFMIPIVDVEHKLERQLESDEFFNGDQIQKKLQKAILSLPEKQRIVFNLRYFEEMKYENMAEILNTSVGSLKASYHHAMKKVEKIILSE